MFDLPKFYLKTVTKIGLAVTFIVFASACGHEMIRPPQAENSILPTPEPMSPPPAQTAPIASHKKSRSGKKIARSHSRPTRVASLSRQPRRMLARGTVKKSSPESKILQVPVAPTVPSQSMASLSLEPIKPASGMWENFLGYWVYGLLILGVAGLFWIASRSRPPTKAKSKRNLIFNS